MTLGIATPAYPTLVTAPDGSLVGRILADQNDLSAVDRLVEFHEHQAEPLQSRYYTALMPATAPGPGQQYAFDVDLDRCSGCKACVAACHSLNGLDDGEVWREVGLLVGGTPALPVLQHVTSSCHHCLDPACLSACPVNAYEKDPETGIVRHLDDQCFGCQYCTLACPYDVPRYHAGMGIVRKCDMCGDRLRAGEAPACVQSCPHEAIRIRVVNKADVHARAEVGVFLPTAFDPTFTRPTTRFRSRRSRDLNRLHAAADQILAPEHTHASLVVMLVLTQLSAGGFLVALASRLSGLGTGEAILLPALLSGLLGLGASLLHLGRPQFAYRAILGLGHSWLSREVVAFAAFAKLAIVLVTLEAFAPLWIAAIPGLRTGLLGAVAVAGLGGVCCSVMVYHVVRRPFWRGHTSGVKFAGTTLVLGLALALSAAPGEAAIAGSLMLLSLGKLGFEARERRERDPSDPLGRTARLLRGPLSRSVVVRVFLGASGGVVLPAAAILASASGFVGVAGVSAVLALAASSAGELVERSLFFRAVVRPKMPGGLPS
jgi:Fe-S-cluster-containing dehydrogenase component/DMSO reductase anchor subunit